MSVSEWCGVIAVAIVPIGGLIAWMFTVARDLGMIAANTDATSKRMDAVADDNAYIREKVDDIDGKVNDHAGKLGELNHRTERLEGILASLKRAAT